MLSFGSMCQSAKGIIDFMGIVKDDRILSYLPLSHSFERFAVESTGIFGGGSLWFAEALDTLTTRDISQIPVVRGKQLLGILRRRDIVRWMQLQSDIGLP